MQLTQPILITTSNDYGAIAKQASSPGTQQTSANINISGAIKANTLDTVANITGATISATSNLNGSIANLTSEVQLNSVTLLKSGTTFPTSGLSDGQRYRHMTYRSWFIYNLTDTKWRQESPGVFDGSFPTVASGDNTVAPKIEVKRVDRGNLIYYWDGADWLGPQKLTNIDTFPTIVTNAITANATNVWYDPHPDGASNVYVESIQFACFVATTNNANSYWTITYRFRDSAAANAVTGSVNTSAFSPGTLNPLTILSNTKITRANFYDVLFDVAKGGATGTPGTLFLEPLKFTFRLY